MISKYASCNPVHYPQLNGVIQWMGQGFHYDDQVVLS